MSFPHIALFVSLAVGAAPNPTASPLPAHLAADEQTLKNAHLIATGPGLLDFFRKRLPSPANRAAVAPLVKQLAGKDVGAQVKAAGELIALGPEAVQQLRIAANDIADPEAAARARTCLLSIEGPTGTTLVVTAARLLAARKPEGAAAALIDYYPYADDEGVTRDLDAALVQVALRDGKPDTVLLQALADETPSRRYAAAVALCRAAGISVHERVRPLLKDPKPTVRFQVALALANAHDADAVPILIDLLGELPSVHRKQAEEWLSELAGDWALKVPQGNDATSRRLRRDLWLAWWNSLDAGQLLDEFRSRTLSDAERTEVLDLIKKLDDDSAEVREQAAQALVALGAKAVPLLRQAAQQNEGRVNGSALQCIERIEKGAPNPLPQAAARLLALRRPARTLETLLAYLPFADSDFMADEIRDLIGAVGFAEGKPAPMLVAALTDEVPARRAAAAHALCLMGSRDQLPAVLRLLQDPDAEVRLLTAQALAAKGQREAVPVLIALLGDVPLQQTWQIEDYLARLAGDKAPQTPPLTADAASRAKTRDVWLAWWKDQGRTVDLAKVDAEQRLLGLTLVVEMFDPTTRLGRVAELDAAGKVRWKIEGLTYPMDAQVLPGQRVLIAEQNAHRVTERDLAGKILWQKDGLISPFIVQRQRNGNTFVGCRNRLVEVDRDGKEVFALARPNDYLLAATKFRDGQMAYVSNQGQYVRVDAKGKEVRQAQIPFNPNLGMNGAEILPNENVLVSVQAIGKIIEYSPDGKIVWEATVQHTGMPYRLRNGQTLVPNQNSRSIAVLDRGGKVVSEMKDLPVRPWRISQR